MTKQTESPGKGLSFFVWGKMLPFLKPYRRLIARVAVLMLAIASVDVVIPLFLRYAVDTFVVPMQTVGMWRFALIYVLVIIFQAGCVVLFSRLCMKIELLVGRDLKREAFVHLQTLSFSYYNTTPVGYILSRVMSDTGKIAAVVAWNGLDLFWSTFYVVGVFISMLILNVRLALAVMLIVPVAAVLTGMFQRKILTANRTVRQINAEMTGAYNEGITGAKTSKTLVIEDQNCTEFNAVTGRMYSAVTRAAFLNAVYIPMILFFGALATAGVLGLGSSMVLRQTLELGLLSSFLSYALGILEPVQQIARGLSEFISAQASIERISELLSKRPEIEDTPQVIEKYGDVFDPKQENWEKVQGDITFDHVSFQYPDGESNVLEDFTLHIPAGTNVAIVGETGAGKSTLVNLACRFYEPTQGRILIDGADYRTRSQLWLHSSLGYVLQNPHLFSGTVEENIRYGRLGATAEQVRDAARLVSAESIIERLDQGFDTQVGENGDRLSTGEKQLISFARAVLADPCIFVLDEATSSVDSETEHLIQHAIAHILRGRTSFLIAHRLSTVRQADLIIVVRDGKIVQSGTHDQLMAEPGYYRELYSAMMIQQFTQEE